MLLVVKFGQYEMMQKTCKTTKILVHMYSSESTYWEKSNEYQHNNRIGFRGFV